MLRRTSLIASLILVGLAIGIVLGGALSSARASVIAPPQAIAQLASVKLPGQVAPLTNNAADDATIIAMVKKAEPAVVTVVNTAQTQTQRNGVVPSIAEGSGVIIDQQGHIVTNAHVVANEQQL